MTALAQRISETPMAPYAALLRGMTREQKQIVVTFITESMEEPAADDAKTAQQKVHVKTESSPARLRAVRGIVVYVCARKDARLHSYHSLSQSVPLFWRARAGSLPPPP